MNLKNLKVYGGMLLIASSLALGPTTSLTTYAEEEEILYEESNDDYELEDIPADETPAPTEEPATPAPTEEPPQATTAPTEEPPSSSVDFENTVIDPEDESYNTGATEIPDSVETEAERKHLTPESPNPTEPPQTTPEPPQETPAPPQETPAPPQETPAPPQETPAPPQETPAPPQETPAPIPKTGENDLVGLIGKIGAGVGLTLGAGICIAYEHARDNLLDGKVVKSRKKFKKKSKTRKR